MRVKILDSLRVIAIIMVMLHHYYGSYTENIKNIFHFGALGVPLFFIISGFVIYGSLEKTKKYTTFLIKRFIRLSPGMLICSSITFLFFHFIYSGDGYEHSKSIANYFIANTFIDPNVFNIKSGYVKYYYIDNAYWSLWVEICFYSLIGILYFITPKNFIKLYTIICFIGLPIFMLFYSSTGSHILQNYFQLSVDKIKYYHLIARAFVFFYDCLWFLIGILLYQLYNSPKNYRLITYICILFFINTIKDPHLELVIFSLITMLFLYLFIYHSHTLSFLTTNWLSKIGVASYSMYLIHYHLGVVFINYLKTTLGYSILYPLITIILVITFGLLSYNFIEKRLTSIYKKLFGL
ncbi:acyltransferase [Riemerella anatipestifer]|nr:acyltransferase [Riemerella anatipestifer]